jgi:hypothetical protein
VEGSCPERGIDWRAVVLRGAVVWWAVVLREAVVWRVLVRGGDGRGNCHDTGVVWTNNSFCLSVELESLLLIENVLK